MPRTTHAQRIRISASLLVISIATAWLLGGRISVSEEQANKPTRAHVTRVVWREIREHSSQTGQVEPRERIEVRSTLDGLLTRVHYRTGRVQRGDLLFELDASRFQLRVKQAVVAVTKAEVSVKRCQLEVARLKRLVAQQAVAIEEFEAKSIELLASEAEHAAARLSLESAELDLAATRVTAPSDGHIDEPLVHPGNVVDRGQLLATIVSHDPQRIVFQMTHDEFAALLRDRRLPKDLTGGGVKLSLYFANQAEAVTGTLDFVAAKFDDESRSIMLRGSFPNPDGKFIPGMRADVRFQFEAPRMALTFPSQVLCVWRETPESHRVMVVDKSNRLVPREIWTHPNTYPTPGTEIVRGLAEGEVIVADDFNFQVVGDEITPIMIEPK